MTDWTPMEGVNPKDYDLLKAVKELRDAAQQLSGLDKADDNLWLWTDITKLLNLLCDRVKLQVEAEELQKKWYGSPAPKTLTVQEKIAIVNALVKTMTMREWAAAHKGIEFVERLLGKDEFERQRKHWESEE